MEIRKIKLSEINPAPYNPRVDLQPGDPEYKKIKRSIKEFGLVDPLIWNEQTKTLVGGHQRLKVIKEMGFTEVTVSVVDLPLEKEKALNIALNKISGDWDTVALKDLLEELDTGALDLEITGFDMEEIEDLMTQFYDEDDVKEDDFDVEEAVEEIEEPIVKPGEVWRLDRHRLICGDATEAEDYKKLLQDARIDLVLTDPPYNVDYEGATKEKLTIKNDDMGSEDFRRFLKESFANMLEQTKEGGPIYIFHADTEGYNFRGALVRAGWLYKQSLVWVKNALVLGRQDYHWRHEPILYGWKPGAAHCWYGDRDKTTVFDDTPNTVLYEKKPAFSREHPTMKPLGLLTKLITNSSKAKENVLDPFGGSGSTLMACEQLNRTCYMMELDPIYCDVIIKRWENFTGQKAVLAE